MKYLLVLFLSGCATVSPKFPMQAQAEDFVWHKVYGMASDPPPVEFVKPDCGNGKGIKGPWYINGTSCFGGLTLTHPLRIKIPRAQHLSDVIPALVHEFMHAYLYLTYGTLDEAHLFQHWLQLPEIKWVTTPGAK